MARDTQDGLCGSRIRIKHDLGSIRSTTSLSCGDGTRGMARSSSAKWLTLSPSNEEWLLDKDSNLDKLHQKQLSCH